MTFVDTSIWYESVIPAEARYQAANDALSAFAGHLILTDYILDETLTLLRSRGHNRQALSLGPLLIGAYRSRLVYVTREDVAAAWEVFRRYSDKEWSFTDCTSKVVMERLGITTALTFDHHFRQFGGLKVLP